MGKSGWYMRPRALMLFFLLALALFRLGYIGQLPITPDEAYYWTWSRDLSVCYYDQPGMVAWVNRVFDPPWHEPSPFSVRLPAVLLSFFGSLLLYLAYRRIYPDENEAVGFIIAVSFLPITYLGGLFMVHDTVLFFFLILSYLFMFRIVRLGKKQDWYFLGLALTAALYSKFSALMPGACFALFILLSKTQRKWLARPEPYIALSMIAVLFLPVILWNYEHDWISVHAVQSLTRHKELTVIDRFSYFFEYTGTQLAAYSPLIWIAVVAALIQAIRRCWRDRSENELLLLSLSVPIWLYFFIQSFSSHVFGNWSAVGYFPALMLLSHYCAEAIKGKTRAVFFFRKEYLFAGMGLAVIMVLSLTLHARYEIFRPAFERPEEKYHLEKRIDWRLDQEFLAWDQLVSLVERARPGTDFILARHYQIASILEFYLHDHPRVLFKASGSRGSQFDIWSDFTTRKDQDALFVDFKPIPSGIEKKFQKIIAVYAPFRLMEREKTRKEFYIYRCLNFKDVR
jgi:4-amino-4-deoxy-L-arabinose transferase-like glycosyltransferase